MGSGNTKMSMQEEAAPKYYRPPDVRQKDRYDPVENSTLSNQFDASIDKVRNQLQRGVLLCHSLQRMFVANLVRIVIEGHSVT